MSIESWTSAIKFLWTLTRSCMTGQNKTHKMIYTGYICTSIVRKVTDVTYWDVEENFVYFRWSEELPQRIQEILGKDLKGRISRITFFII